jgi:subtilisin family serine protease
MNERLALERREQWNGPPKFWRAPPESLLQQGLRSIGSRASALATGAAPPASTVRTVHLDPSIATDSAAYASIEQEVQATGARIIEKHSDAIQDILVIEAPAEAIESVAGVAGVQGVAPRGSARPAAVQAKSSGGDALVFSGSDACTATDAAIGATKLDTLPFEVKSILNDGAGVLVIVWDFAPNLDEKKWGDELVKRPGGKAKQYNVTSASPRSWHGSSVMSVCCGANAGPARGATLALVSLGDTVSSDLTVINNLLKTWTGPAVVNMSFAVTYQVKTDADRIAVRDEFRRFDSFVIAMKTRNPRLVFVVAAGNEGRDLCDVVDVPDDQNGRVMQWPQQRFSTASSITDSTYIFVGATIALAGAGTVRHALAGYSNFGRCVNAVSPGGWTCAYRAESGNEAPFHVTQGTSFAAPAASGLLALVLAARPNATGVEAMQALLSGSRKVARPGYEGTIVALPMYAAPPLDGTTPPPVGVLPDPQVIAPQGTLSPPEPQPQTSSYLPWLALLVGGVVVLALFAASSFVAVVVAGVVVAVVVILNLVPAGNSSSSPPPVEGVPRPAR